MEQFQRELDRLIPEDESQPLRGQYFRDWEDQSEQIIETVSQAFLEERAKLEQNAEHGHPGACLHCGDPHTYFLAQEVNGEKTSCHGKVAMPLQYARCRRCGRTFSPSGTGLAAAGGGAADAQGGGEGGPGSGPAKL
jgi:hypothetical protein